MGTTELETVTLHVADQVATVTLNRPDALNAWTRQFGEELTRALEEAAADPEVRAVVITGAGRAFSSGADLKSPGPLRDDGTIDVETPLREVYNPLILRVRTVPKPVIAAVNGPAVGIGTSLALACDLVVMAESAYLLLAFANIGLALDGGASVSLLARAGHARAFEMAFLADRIPAERALAWGLANEVVPDGETLDRASEIAKRLARGAPGAYATIKRTINEQAYPRFAEALELEAVLQQERASSDDFKEGVMAFLQKRPAQFTGR